MLTKSASPNHAKVPRSATRIDHGAPGGASGSPLALPRAGTAMKGNLARRNTHPQQECTGHSFIEGAAGPIAACGEVGTLPQPGSSLGDMRMKELYTRGVVIIIAAYEQFVH